MSPSTIYHDQVSLLMKCLPFIAREDCFALKGGTAINLFVQDFPRLSVDIDLVYLPLDSWSEALDNIKNALGRIAQELNDSLGVSAVLQENKLDELRIIVNTSSARGLAQVKIEVSPVARGTIFDAKMLDVVERVEQQFGFASIKVVSTPDLYGGKLCAALDRQHPRDLFDVKMLLDSGGFNREIFIGFLAYALSHNRPISEIMSPRWKDISVLYKNEFSGMTFVPVQLDSLIQTQEGIVESLARYFTQEDHDFLLSFKSGAPDWSLFPNDRLKHLPAVKWKLRNIEKMSEHKRRESLTRLKDVLSVWLRYSK